MEYKRIDWNEELATIGIDVLANLSGIGDIEEAITLNGALGFHFHVSVTHDTK